MDNAGPHKQESVGRWLSRHPRFQVHYTPTSSSWLNLVERFFGELAQDVIRDGGLASVQALVRDIEAYLAERNLAPKPYRLGGSASGPREDHTAQAVRSRPSTRLGDGLRSPSSMNSCGSIFGGGATGYGSIFSTAAAAAPRKPGYLGPWTSERPFTLRSL